MILGQAARAVVQGVSALRHQLFGRTTKPLVTVKRVCWPESSGEQIVVTRHRKPVALITSVKEQHDLVGSRFGKWALKPLFKRPATQGRYLSLLDADRREELDPR